MKTTLSKIFSIVMEEQNKISNFAPEIQEIMKEVMEKESAVSFKLLWLLIQQGLQVQQVAEQETINKIKIFLAIRWYVIQDTNLAYTYHPFLPINAACLRIAELISSPQEAICKVLMPSIKKVIGPMLGNTIQENTEEQQTSQEGMLERKFFVYNFFSIGNQLFSIPDLFEYASQNTAYLLPRANQNTSEIKFELNSQALLYLQCIAENDSQVYWHTLIDLHIKKENKYTFGYKIAELGFYLKQASVSEQGNEFQANTLLAGKAIKNVYDLWRKLEQNIKVQICQYILPHHGKVCTVENFLLTLFDGHYECELSAEEKTKNLVYPCLDQISNALNEFLIKYPHLYSISLNSDTTEAEPIDFEKLQAKLLNSLKSRHQFTLNKDNEIFSKLEQCFKIYSDIFSLKNPICYYAIKIILDDTELSSQISITHKHIRQNRHLILKLATTLSNSIKSAKQLGLLCNLLLIEDIEKLIHYPQLSIKNIISTPIQLGSFLRYVKYDYYVDIIPLLDFEIKSLLKDVKHLARLLEYIFKNDKLLAIPYLEPYINFLLFSNNHLVSLLKEIPTALYPEVIKSLSLQKNQLFSTAPLIASIFTQLPINTYDALYIGLAPLLEKTLTNTLAISEFISQFSTTEAFTNIVEMVFPLIKKYLNTHQELVILLGLIPKKLHLPTIKILTQKNSLSIQSPKELNNFLRKLSLESIPFLLEHLSSTNHLVELIKNDINKFLASLSQIRITYLLNSIKSFSSVITDNQILIDCLNLLSKKNKRIFLKNLEDKLPVLVQNIEQLDSIINLLPYSERMHFEKIFHNLLFEFVKNGEDIITILTTLPLDMRVNFLLMFENNLSVIKNTNQLIKILSSLYQPTILPFFNMIADYLPRIIHNSHELKLFLEYLPEELHTPIILNYCSFTISLIRNYYDLNLILSALPANAGTILINSMLPKLTAIIKNFHQLIYILDYINEDNEIKNFLIILNDDLPILIKNGEQLANLLVCLPFSCHQTLFEKINDFYSIIKNGLQLANVLSKLAAHLHIKLLNQWQNKIAQISPLEFFKILAELPEYETKDFLNKYLVKIILQNSSTVIKNMQYYFIPTLRRLNQITSILNYLPIEYYDAFVSLCRPHLKIFLINPTTLINFLAQINPDKQPILFDILKEYLVLFLYDLPNHCYNLKKIYSNNLFLLIKILKPFFKISLQKRDISKLLMLIDTKDYDDFLKLFEIDKLNDTNLLNLLNQSNRDALPCLTLALRKQISGLLEQETSYSTIFNQLNPYCIFPIIDTFREHFLRYFKDRKLFINLFNRFDKEHHHILLNIGASEIKYWITDTSQLVDFLTQIIHHVSPLVLESLHEEIFKFMSSYQQLIELIKLFRSKYRSQLISNIPFINSLISTPQHFAEIVNLIPSKHILTNLIALEDTIIDVLQLDPYKLAVFINHLEISYYESILPSLNIPIYNTITEDDTVIDKRVCELILYLSKDRRAQLLGIMLKTNNNFFNYISTLSISNFVDLLNHLPSDCYADLIQGINVAISHIIKDSIQLADLFNQIPSNRHPELIIALDKVINFLLHSNSNHTSFLNKIPVSNRLSILKQFKVYFLASTLTIGEMHNILDLFSSIKEDEELLNLYYDKIVQWLVDSKQLAVLLKYLGKHIQIKILTLFDIKISSILTHEKQWADLLLNILPVQVTFTIKNFKKHVLPFFINKEMLSNLLNEIPLDVCPILIHTYFKEVINLLPTPQALASFLIHINSDRLLSVITALTTHISCLLTTVEELAAFLQRVPVLKHANLLEMLINFTQNIVYNADHLTKLIEIVDETSYLTTLSHFKYILYLSPLSTIEELASLLNGFPSNSYFFIVTELKGLIESLKLNSDPIELAKLLNQLSNDKMMNFLISMEKASLFINFSDNLILPLMKFYEALSLKNRNLLQDSLALQFKQALKNHDQLIGCLQRLHLDNDRFEFMERFQTTIINIISNKIILFETINKLPNTVSKLFLILNNWPHIMTLIDNQQELKQLLASFQPFNDIINIVKNSPLLKPLISFVFNLMVEKSLVLAREFFKQASLENQSFILSTMKSEDIYVMVYEVGNISHDLKVMMPELSKAVLDIAHQKANFFILHNLFAYKTRDNAYYNSFNVFIDILQQLKSTGDIFNYHQVISFKLSQLAESVYKIGFLNLGKHPLRIHLDTLIEIPEQTLKTIVPEYINSLSNTTALWETTVQSKFKIELNNKINTPSNMPINRSMHTYRSVGHSVR